MGLVRFRLVGTKNLRPEALLAEGRDLFAEELEKGADQKVAAKVVEITRTLLVARRP